MRARNDAIWARVTGSVGQYRVGVQPVVIPASCSHSMSVLNVDPPMSVNGVEPAELGLANAMTPTRQRMATRADRASARLDPAAEDGGLEAWRSLRDRGSPFTTSP